jgi:hypothetical protein
LGRRLGGPESHYLCGGEEKILPFPGIDLKSSREGHKMLRWWVDFVHNLVFDKGDILGNQCCHAQVKGREEATILRNEKAQFKVALRECLYMLALLF